MLDNIFRQARVVPPVLLLFLASCASTEPRPTQSVASAWRSRSANIHRFEAEGDALNHGVRNTSGAVDVGASGPVVSRDEVQATLVASVASVNGRPVSRDRFIALLIESQGVSLLEQMIGLETAVSEASRRGLVVSQVDVDREYEQALMRLVDPLSAVTSSKFDLEEAKGLLDSVLARRGMSHGEFRMIIRRNAHLRKIIESQQSFTEDQLRREFKRTYGRRVVVRHIQLATIAQVQRVRDRLVSGESFESAASKFSANRASAESGGLLDPFSETDDEIPALFRETAFAMVPGEISDALRVGEWHHLIKVDRFLSPESHDFELVRGALERSLRKRVTDTSMYALFEKLFDQATITIEDPDLREAFDARHPGRIR